MEFVEMDYKVRGYNPKPKHFHYPIEPMLKLIAFKRLMGIRWNKVLAERLKNNVHGCAELLGFGDKAPSRISIGRFFNDYLGVDGHWNLLDKLVVRLKREMDARGITFGESVGVDSTPLPVMRNDQTGEVNGHYYEKYGIFKMIKVHIMTCLDTGIVMGVIFSGANDYDGYHLIPLVEKAKSLGFKIKEVYGDGHYNNFTNWAVLSVTHGIDCYFNMPEDVKYKPVGTLPKIQKKYQEYHNEVDWLPTDNEYKMMRYLLEKGHYDYVGGYFNSPLKLAIFSIFNDF